MYCQVVNEINLFKNNLKEEYRTITILVINLLTYSGFLELSKVKNTRVLNNYHSYNTAIALFYSSKTRLN